MHKSQLGSCEVNHAPQHHPSLDNHRAVPITATIGISNLGGVIRDDYDYDTLRLHGFIFEWTVSQAIQEWLEPLSWPISIAAALATGLAGSLAVHVIIRW
jgi:hypothetical protein